MPIRAFTPTKEPPFTTAAPSRPASPKELTDALEAAALGIKHSAGPADCEARMRSVVRVLLGELT